MPKMRSTGGKNSNLLGSRTCKIGTRKNGTSAKLMSKAKLLSVIKDKNQKRYHQIAHTELQNRGINF